MPAIMKSKREKPTKAVVKSETTKTKPTKKKIAKKQTLISAPLLGKKVKRSAKFDPLKANRGVVFIKHIPHGFYEEQLKNYFGQYGSVTRVRVARSERSGKSKGYAFVEFQMPEVAEIAAKSMDNYLMFKQKLKTAYIPPDKQKHNFFRSTVKIETDSQGLQYLSTPTLRRSEAEARKTNTVPTDEQHENRVKRALYKIKKQQEKYASMNINVNFSQAIQNEDTSDKVGKTIATKKAASEKKKLKKKNPIERSKSTTTSNEENSDAEVVEPEPSKKRKAIITKQALAAAKSAKKSKLEASSEEVSPVLTGKKNKQRNVIVVSKKPIDESFEQSSDGEEFDFEDDSDDEEASALTPKSGKKNLDTTLTRLVNETFDDESGSDDEDFEPKLEFEEDSDVDESDDFEEAPVPVVLKKQKKPVQKPSIVESAKTLKKTAQFGGIQKRVKKPIASVAPNKQKQSKLKLAATELIQTTSKNIKKLKATDLKKKPKSR